MKLTVDCDPRFGTFPAGPVRSIVEEVWRSEGVDGGEIHVIFGDDELLSRLKQEFFSLSQYTDVIAFRLNEYEEPQPEGEIYISLPRAKENAVLYGEDLRREIARYLIHGCLHLLGYDDQTEAEQEAMRRREDTCLDRVPWQKIPTKRLEES